MDKRQQGKPVKFVGWIYGNEDDEESLRSNGVSGKMCWSTGDNTKSITVGAHKKKGSFSHCTLDSIEAAEKLYKIYAAFWAGSFTGLRKDGEQTIYQPLWKMGHEDKDHKNAEGTIVSNFSLLG